MSLEEQKKFKSTSSASTSEIDNQLNCPPPSLYGAWKSIKNDDANQIIDLQLPGQDLSQIMEEISQKADQSESKKKPDFEFKEKTIESLKRPISSNKDGTISFKKRSTKQNIRLKFDDD